MSTTLASRLLQWLFSVTVFLSAALLFQIQPLMSKLILPWFGGSPSVWTVCLLFFQAVLFLGYLLAHGLIERLSPRWQWGLHTLLMGAALAAPILPSEAWLPTAGQNQVGQILVLLSANIGLPYLLLSATSPLLQVWFARACPGVSPYRLYALSNLGSIVGLLAYPLVVDMWLSTSQQAALWHGAFAFFVVACSLCGWFASAAGGPQLTPSVKSTGVTHASRWEIVQWLALSMLPSLLLSAVTTKLTVDITPVPFLWVVPLTLYLVSLIICFSKESWANRKVWGVITALMLALCGYLIGGELGTVSTGSLPLQFTVHLGTFFAVCMTCHGEMVRLKPQASGETAGGALTEFYLVTSAGGAIGGLFVAVIAPALFSMFLEYPIGLVLAAVVPTLIWLGNSPLGWFHERHLTIWVGLLLILTSLGIGITRDVRVTMKNVHLISRNFYGVIRVIEKGQENPAGSYFDEVHGGTRHGCQMVRPEVAALPTTYYAFKSGVARLLQTHHNDRPRRIGVIGLGVGTLATYGRPGDVIDFYEIDDTVIDLAKNFFRYLGDSQAQINVFPGDARLSLAQGEPRQYDILVLDAFSSDAIPIHLLTAEAFEMYRKNLAPDGVIAAHISNQYFDLHPVMAGHARKLQWRAVSVTDDDPDTEKLALASIWVLISSSADTIDRLSQGPGARRDLGTPLEWTDSRHNVLDVLMWH